MIDNPRHVLGGALVIQKLVFADLAAQKLVDLVGFALLCRSLDFHREIFVRALRGSSTGSHDLAIDIKIHHGK